MDFSLKEKPKLNKDLILSTLTEEQIFGFYIGSEIKSKKLFRSKLRNDKNPTCSMYRNKSGSLIYKDFATDQYLNCFGYVMELFRCNYYTALQIIANDFNIIHDDSFVKNKGKIIPKEFKIEEKEFSKIQIEAQEFTDLELKWWAKYGITLEILKKYNVYSCKHIFLNGQLIAKSQQHCPIFGYYGKKYQGNELWKIYFPKRKEGRFMGNYPSKKMQGYEQLPKTGKICVITKAQKDCMTLYSLGIPACAPNSETVIPSENIINDLKKRFKYIICLWDNDYTGISFLNKFKKKYPELIYTWIPKKLGAKDISDFYKENGKQKTLNLIKEFLLWLKKRRKN
jgi:hypothetical protein